MGDAGRATCPDGQAAMRVAPRRGRVAIIVAVIVAVLVGACALAGFALERLVDSVDAPRETYVAEATETSGSVRRIAHGHNLSVVIRKDGTLWVWVQDGDASSDGAEENAGRVEIRVGDDTSWSAVAAARARLLALKSDGTLWSVEPAPESRTAPSTEDSFVPVQVGNDIDWAQVAVGADHAAALKSDGTLWAWGDNAAGQLGISGVPEVAAPARVGESTDWVNVAAGGNGTFGIRADGTLWAAGTDDGGLSWAGPNADRATMSRIGTDADWTAVSVSPGSAFAIRRDGSLWEFPRTDPHYADPAYRYAPIRVGVDTGWQTVAAESDYVLAVKSDGTLWAWGYLSDLYELGCALEPAQVGMERDWTWVAATSQWERACAVKRDGSVWRVRQE